MQERVRYVVKIRYGNVLRAIKIFVHLLEGTGGKAVCWLPTTYHSLD
jgi:hypothetical protein